MQVQSVIPDLTNLQLRGTSRSGKGDSPINIIKNPAGTLLRHVRTPKKATPPNTVIKGRLSVKA